MRMQVHQMGVRRGLQDLQLRLDGVRQCVASSASTARVAGRTRALNRVIAFIDAGRET